MFISPIFRLVNNFSHIPLCRLILPFIAGILAFLAVGLFFSLEYFLLVYFLIIAGWIISVYTIKLTYSRRWYFGFFATSVFFISGYHISQNHYQIANNGHFSKIDQGAGHLVIQLTEEVSEKANSFQVVARVQKIIRNDSVFQVNGRMILYLQKDSLAALLKYGDLILVENNYQEISAPKNPYQFNFQRFLAYKNIYHQTYRKSGEWEMLGVNQGNVLKATSLRLRRSALDAFKENNLTGDEYAVVSALLFGYTEYLNEDLMQEYSGSGAMHLLSVSGLHVGIIYMALKFMLSFLNGFKQSRFLKSFLTVLFIWFYAAITGFSPSVLRAGTMFTFLAIGQNLGRNNNIYNTLAGSAFFLLAYDPYLITQIGFQLSYLAVIAIVALQPPLQNLVKTKFKILDWLWALTTVSIAAQLVTGPIALYYFDQFPNYFLITNLVVVPLSTLIIYLSIATLGLSWVPWIADFLGQIVGFLVYAMNQSVKFIEALPYSTFSGVHISFLETLCLLALGLFFGRYFLLQKSRAHFVAGLATVLLLLISISAGNLQTERNSKFIVYHVPRATAFEFTKGRKSVFFGCEMVESNSRNKGFHINPFRVTEGIDTTLYLPAKDIPQGFYLGSVIARENLLRLGNVNVFWMHPDTPERLVTPGLRIHYLLVSQNPRNLPEEIIRTLKPEMVILDSSNNRWTIEKWAEASAQANIPVWPVAVRGAYLANLAQRSD